LTRNKTITELRDLIFEKTIEFTVDGKLSTMWTVIPYFSLEKDSIAKILQTAFLTLPCKYEMIFQMFHCSTAALDRLTENWSTYGSLRKRNGRGVAQTLIDTYITPLIEQEIMSGVCKKCTFNLDWKDGEFILFKASNILVGNQ
jgi:hypothetical protein